MQNTAKARSEQACRHTCSTCSTMASLSRWRTTCPNSGAWRWLRCQTVMQVWSHCNNYVSLLALSCKQTKHLVALENADVWSGPAAAMLDWSSCRPHQRLNAGPRHPNLRSGARRWLLGLGIDVRSDGSGWSLHLTDFTIGSPHLRLTKVAATAVMCQLLLLAHAVQAGTSQSQLPSEKSWAPSKRVVQPPRPGRRHRLQHDMPGAPPPAAHGFPASHPVLIMTWVEPAALRGTWGLHMMA
jgi:hypothetical protein